jgi:mono/diheme cytochrome c family protein
MARGPVGADDPAPADGSKYFDTQIRPILQSQCAACHTGDKPRGGLNLSTRESLLKGGDTGPAVVPEKPADSLLVRAIAHMSDLKMPPKGKLTQTQIDTLTTWVKMGATWPEGRAIAKPDGPPLVDDRARNFWSFRPVVRPAVPIIDTRWVQNPVDAFVLAKLTAKGLAPAPPAEKTSLLRRVYYDLIGLPPSPEEVEVFLKDTSPDAFEKVVDRLLASSHYGERWARHWLDLVRYAETNGYEFDTAKPSVWRYRDYVIRSINDDKPYDRFVREQLAGDELTPPSTDALVATGFYRLGVWDGGAPDRLQAQYDELDDILSTTGQVFLGLTVQCARCHDHKVDPFPQKDYYRLLAFVHNVQRYNPRSAVRTIGDKVDTDLQKQEIAAFKDRLTEVNRQMTAIEAALLPHLAAGEKDDFASPEKRQDVIRKHVPEHVTSEDYERYVDRVREKAQLERRKPSGLAQALCVSENGPRAPETFVLLRGNPRSPGDKVEPGFPSVLPAVAPGVPKAGTATTGRRTVLADWIASPTNPLTARVMVNRVWQHHFGRGIVRSASDFGFRGAPPTHPELLDWLAAEFVEKGWRLKPLHRLIVTSNAYRMSSRPDPACLTKDPENDLFWRFDPRRLSAEEVRDSMLAAAGNLNLTAIGGPSIYPKLDRQVLQGQSMPGVGWPTSPPEEATRRSLYVHTKRSLPVPFLTAFDAADPDASCPVRFTTTQPTQALAMLNGEFANEQSQLLAVYVRKKAGDKPADQIRMILWRVTQRPPAKPEIDRGDDFLIRQREVHKTSEADALQRFGLLALNLNEFIYLD